MIDRLKLTKAILEMEVEQIVKAVMAKSFPRNPWGKITKQSSRVLEG
ncbi:hypothetical protein A2U01_0110768, partial [Trifolium medium]|nr:hypothetical protein [Trifolium medium]